MIYAREDIFSAVIRSRHWRAGFPRIRRVSQISRFFHSANPNAGRIAGKRPFAMHIPGTMCIHWLHLRGQWHPDRNRTSGNHIPRPRDLRGDVVCLPLTIKIGLNGSPTRRRRRIEKPLRRFHPCRPYYCRTSTFPDLFNI